MSPDPHTTRAAAPPVAPLKALLRRRAESFVATLVLVQGDTDILDPDAGRPRAAEQGIRISSHTRIAVRSGRALVRMDDGSDIWLAAGAVLDLGGWDRAVRLVRLVAGRALALVAREATRPFRVRTTVGEATALGTAFETHATADAVEVSVLHGTVELRTIRGAATLERGWAGSARIAAPPERRPLAPDSGRWDWLPDVASSAQNARVAPAFRAVAHTLATAHGTQEPDTTMNNTHRRGRAALAIVGVLAIALLGGGIYLATAKEKPKNDMPIADALRSVSTPDGGNVLKPNVEAKRAIKLRLKGADGQPIEIEADSLDDASIEKALANVPEAKRDEVRKMLQGIRDRQKDGKGSFSFTAGGPGTGGPGIDEKTAQNLERDVKGGVDAMRELIAQGMSPEEASRIVSQGLTESLQKQLKASGSDANLKVSVMSGDQASGIVGPDGKPVEVPAGANIVMIGVEDTAEVPADGTEVEINVGDPPKEEKKEDGKK